MSDVKTFVRPLVVRVSVQALTPAIALGGMKTASGIAGGDLSGAFPTPSVVRLRGRAITDAAPTDGQLISWSNAEQRFVFTAPSAVGAAGGDLKGSYPNPSVKGLQGRPVSAATPATNNALVWNGSEWIPAAPVVPSDASKVDVTRQLAAGTGITGGGDLSSNRTFSVDFAASGTSSATKAVRADDSRLSNARTPLAHGHAISDVSGLQPALNGKAALSHTHSISDVTGLQQALLSKSFVIAMATAL